MIVNVSPDFSEVRSFTPSDQTVADFSDFLVVDSPLGVDPLGV